MDSRCRHEYQDSPGKMCSADRLHRWWAGQDPALQPELKQGIGLPIDESGLCVFHSDDPDFQEREHLLSRFRDLVRLSFRADVQGFDWSEVLDCEDFKFSGVCDVDPVVADSRIIDLSELQIGQACSFLRAIFLDTVWFTDAKFVKSCQFDSCVFTRDAYFDQASFEGRVLFNRVRFLGDSGFRETRFNASVQFASCDFQGSAAFNQTFFGNYADFTKAKFGRVFFMDCVFATDVNDHVVTFDQADFCKLARFERTRFETEVSFIGCKFEVAEFLDTVFSPTRKTAFDSIRVKEKLVFKSSIPDQKVFQYLVSFDQIRLNELEGQILFEYANIYQISNWTNFKVLAEPSVGKVKIGTGCDKYRLRVEHRVNSDPRWKVLIAELAETFVMFFEMSGGFDVRLSCEVEFVRPEILVRYFSDSDMSREEFAQLIGHRVPLFAELIKDPVAFVQNALSDQSETVVDLYVEYADILAKMTAFNLRVAARLAKGQLNLMDLAAIVEAAGVNDRNVSITIENNIIKQYDFLSIGTRKFAAGGNLTEGSTGL